MALNDKIQLPSLETYNVIQDAQGYIWIATDHGLCRYNGQQGTRITLPDEIPNEAIYFMEKQADSSIIAISSKHRIFKIKDGHIQLLAYSHYYARIIQKLIDNLWNQKYAVTYHYSEKNGNPVLTTNQATIELDLQKRKVKIPNLEMYQVKNYIRIEGTTQPYVINYTARNNINPQHFDIILHQKDTLSIVAPIAQSSNWRRLIQYHNGTYYLTINEYLICIDADDHQIRMKAFDGHILDLYFDPKGGLWVGCAFSGLYQIKNPRHLDAAQRHLKEYSVSKTVIDHEGGIWCSTLEKGVFYSQNMYVQTFSTWPSLRKKLHLIKAFPPYIIAISDPNDVFVIHNDTVIQSQIGASALRGTDIVYLKNRWYISSKDYLTYYSSLRRNAKIPSLVHVSKSYVRQMDTIQNQIWAIGIDLLTILDSDLNTLFQKRFSLRLKTICRFNDSTVYIGTDQGILQTHPQKRDFIKLDKTSHLNVNCFYKLNSILFIGTKGSGLYALYKNKTYTLLPSYYPETQYIQDITADKQSNLWLATLHGVFKINFKKSPYEVQKINTQQGLPANEIFNIETLNNHVYLNTSEGLCMFTTPVQTTNQNEPRIYLRQILVNNQPFTASQTPSKFVYNQNNIRFDLDILTFKTNSNSTPIIRYQLNGLSDEIKWSNSSQLVFENLPAGTYQLTAYGLNSDGLSSPTPFRFAFTILPPFWRRPLFIISLSILFAASVGVIVYYRIRFTERKKIEKERIEKEIAQSRLTALQAQMNPHFVFNAINSIQNYILKNQEKEAYEYLTKFSKLIRQTLSMSRKSLISLQEEIETLHVYVELEQLRYLNQFEVEFYIDPQLEPEFIELPTMIVQPYVENAIWHGLLHLKNERKGRLKISFTTEHDLLKISIEDNGVGRQFTQHIQAQRQHNSVAMHINEERLQIIKAIQQRKEIQVRIDDLTAADGSSLGTHVTLYLPLTYYA